MARQAGIVVENSFKGGLVTEASGLNFPENSCTETYNCVFNFDGSVQRRLGFDFETDYAEKTISRTGNVISSYLWKNVSGNGDVTLLVLQVGPTLYFYETDADAVSAGAVSTTVSLATYAASGAPTTETLECQFSSGNGLLFVTHPYCDPFYVSYNTSTQTASATRITIKIRDFEGATADPYAVDERPTATLAGLNVSHKYNLYNQGWGNAPAGSSTGLSTTNLAAWDTAFTTMPSNADVMWAFKNASDAFDTATVPNVPAGNTPAPKGHFILTLSNQDRDTASGLSGVTATTTSYYRPSSSAFFAGRLFYAGINYTGFNSKIYFSQIVERNEQYAFCYQANDPTSEDNFDLLPSDGGVISIPEAGTIYKIVSIIGGLAVFAANGVWFIAGSTGLGFTANDYVVQKISSINAISATSFVDVGGYPSWWNAEGIYLLTSEGNSPTVQSLTDQKIKSFMDDIPYASKLQARGYFNITEGRIQWLFRDTVAATPDEVYEYNYILNFDTLTGAFYPWSITASDVDVHSIVVLEGAAGGLILNNTVDDSANSVVDDSANDVVSYSAANTSSSPTFIYVVSYASGGSHKFTFAASRSTDYLDWQSYGDNSDYTSYFTTGYKVHGEGLRNFQSNYVRIFSRNSVATQFYIRGMWGYSTSSDTGRWSSQQLVTHTDVDYSTVARRLKIRGNGPVLQFHVTSIEGQPFDILGWSVFETANAAP